MFPRIFTASEVDVLQRIGLTEDDFPNPLMITAADAASQKARP